MQSIEGGERHGRAPAVCIIRLKLPAITGEDDPALRERRVPVELHQIIATQTSKIGRGKYNEDRPSLVQVEVSRNGNNGHRLSWHVLGRI